MNHECLNPERLGSLRIGWRGQQGGQYASWADELPGSLAGGTVTVGLDTMERDGLVQRKKDATDGGILRIFLTERGRRLKEVLEPAAAALIHQMFAPFAAEEYKTLSLQIARLRKSVPKVDSTVEEQD